MELKIFAIQRDPRSPVPLRFRVYGLGFEMEGNGLQVPELAVPLYKAEAPRSKPETPNL